MKRKVCVFASYARRDSRLFKQFMDELDANWRASSTWEYSLWMDALLLAGEEFAAEIQAGIAGCDIGLLPISPSFLGSTYIRQYELPAFIGENARPALPFLLSPIDLDGQADPDLRRLEIFALRTVNGVRKSYLECDPVERRKFVLEFFKQGEKRLGKLPSPAATP